MARQGHVEGFVQDFLILKCLGESFPQSRHTQFPIPKSSVKL